jgi:hypothetical protein
MLVRTIMRTVWLLITGGGGNSGGAGGLAWFEGAGAGRGNTKRGDCGDAAQVATQ